MKSEELGIISDRVFRYGVAIALGLIIIGGFFEATRYFRKKIVPSQPTSDSSQSVKLRIPICEKAKSAELSGKDKSARQLQNWNCLSGLVTLPSNLEMGSLRYSFPGTTEIYECRKANDQNCFLVKEVTAKNAGQPIVFPTRMRLRGDPGEVRFKLTE